MVSIEHTVPASTTSEEARPPELSYPALFLRFLGFEYQRNRKPT